MVSVATASVLWLWRETEKPRASKSSRKALLSKS